jgi:hypothetical protein
MTTKKLQEIIAASIKEHGDLPVMVNTATFEESENGTVFEVEAAKVERVQGVDDSGPVGRKYPMLVITGNWGDPR